MDGFIDRLAELWKSLFGSANEPDQRPGDRSSSSGEHMSDPDFRAAWEELNEYIRTGSSRPRDEGAGRRARAPRSPDESLRQDYANLEVPFGADIEDVRASYKRLMLKYHPDKHAGNPEKQRLALEIAKKINQSFERIRNHQEG